MSRYATGAPRRASRGETQEKASAKARKVADVAALIAFGKALAEWDGIGPRPVDPRSLRGTALGATSPWRKQPATMGASDWAINLHVGMAKAR